MRAAASAILLALSAAAFAGDVVELEGGRVVEGRIVREEKVWVGVKVDHELVWLRRAEITSIRRDVKPAPRPAPRTQDAEAETAEGSDTNGPQQRAERMKRTKRTGASSGQLPTPKSARTPGAASTARDAELSAEGEAVRRGLASTIRDERLKAAQWIVETWPRWRSAIKATLKHEKSETARVVAVQVLDRDGVDDVASLLEIAMSDAGATVRAAALRVARHRRHTGLESRAIALMRTDPTWRVRQEAIRALEDIGGAMCLPHVMAAWSSETDEGRRRRYRRVMSTLLGDDFGDDGTAWYHAAAELAGGERKLRVGKADKPGERAAE